MSSECHLTIGVFILKPDKKLQLHSTYPDCLHIGCIMESWKARKASGNDQDFPNPADRPASLHHSHEPWKHKMAPLTQLNETQLSINE